jgi:hypothetical protein
MPELIRGPTQESAPSQYTLAPRQAIIPESVTATFDGSLAAGAFLPTLSIYAQSGELLARCPATSVAAGSSAEVTFAPLLRAAQAAAASSAGLSWANWKSETFTVTPGGIAYQFADGDYLETNDTATFDIGPSAAVGTNGLTKVLLIQRQGVYLTVGFARYLVSGGGPDEPVASIMWANWDSFNYAAGQLDTDNWNAEAVTGKPSAPFGATIRNRWFPWGTDMILYEDPIAAPFMEYVPSLFNAGAQNMTVNSYLLSIRLSDSTPFDFIQP